MHRVIKERIERLNTYIEGITKHNDTANKLEELGSSLAQEGLIESYDINVSMCNDLILNIVVAPNLPKPMISIKGIIGLIKRRLTPFLDSEGSLYLGSYPDIHLDFYLDGCSATVVIVPSRSCKMVEVSREPTQEVIRVLDCGGSKFTQEDFETLFDTA